MESPSGDHGLSPTNSCLSSFALARTRRLIRMYGAVRFSCLPVLGPIFSEHFHACMHAKTKSVVKCDVSRTVEWLIEVYAHPMRLGPQLSILTSQLATEYPSCTTAAV